MMLMQLNTERPRSVFDWDMSAQNPKQFVPVGHRRAREQRFVIGQDGKGTSFRNGISKGNSS